MRILTGIQPSGALHLGNYFGAMLPAIQLQDEGEAYYFIANYHSMTSLTDAALRRQYSRDVALDFMACGLDPKRCIFWKQSDTPEHTELAWILACQTAMGEASRMTQFKDKTAKGQTANVGLFTYPILMAADILLYDADLVPVGEDQRQHLELTRDLAERMNSRFGRLLTVPSPYIVQGSAKVMDLQDPTSKMSKSLSSDNGLIDLLDDPKRIVKKIKSAVTDTEREIRYDVEAKPGVSNLLVIHSTLSGTPVADLERQFEGKGYGDLKGEVAEVVVAAIEPFQARFNELLADPAELDRILVEGSAKAGEVAAATLARVRAGIGLLPRA